MHQVLFTDAAREIGAFNDYADQAQLRSVDRTCRLHLKDLHPIDWIFRAEDAPDFNSWCQLHARYLGDYKSKALFQERHAKDVFRIAEWIQSIAADDPNIENKLAILKKIASVLSLCLPSNLQCSNERMQEYVEQRNLAFKKPGKRGL